MSEAAIHSPLLNFTPRLRLRPVLRVLDACIHASAPDVSNLRKRFCGIEKPGSEFPTGRLSATARACTQPRQSPFNKIARSLSATPPGGRDQPVYAHRPSGTSQFTSHHLLVSDPIQLNNAMFPPKGLMPAISVGRAAKSEEYAPIRRNREHHILQVILAPEQTQASARALRIFIHVYQKSYNLASSIGMNLAIISSAASTYGNHSRPPRRVYPKIILHGCPEFRPAKLRQKRFKCSPIIKFSDWEAPGLRDAREIRV